MLPPRVSVIVTSYNQQEYSREAIESAINQTVAAFEIIVADDHSTKDGSIETIREYAERVLRIGSLSFSGKKCWYSEKQK